LSLTRRKVKSLTRDQATYRDDRIFWVGTDDRYAPKQYLDFLKVKRVRIFALAAEERTQAAREVVQRLKAAEEIQEQDQVWALLDADHYDQGRHLPSFLEALRGAWDAGIQVAISKPCFEVWLLLHYADAEAVEGVASASEVETRLREAIGEYNKRQLKQAHYPEERVKLAMARAQELDARVAGGEIPQSATTRVYQLLEAIGVGLIK